MGYRSNNFAQLRQTAANTVGYHRTWIEYYFITSVLRREKV